MLVPQHLLDRTASGDAAAWQELQRVAAPLISAFARRHPSLRARGLARSHDDVHDVLTSSLERLKSRNFHSLARYLEKTRDIDPVRRQSFESWLYGMVEYVVREHVRERYGRASRGDRSSRAGGPTLTKRDVGSFAGRLDGTYAERGAVAGRLDGTYAERGAALGVTLRMTVAALRAFVRERCSAVERRAFDLYYEEGRTFDELAAALPLVDARAAERLIRRINARLRYQFEARVRTRKGGAKEEV